MTPSAIRGEPTVGSQTVGLPCARAPSARVGHSNPARRNPYAQRSRPLVPDDAASATARHAAGPRVTPAAIRDEPTARNQATNRRRTPATAVGVGHFDPARRNAYARSMRPLAPGDGVLAPPRHAAGPCVTPCAVQDEPTVRNQTTNLPRARATRAQAGHFNPPRRNPYAQGTRPMAPDDAASAPTRSAVGPRATPSAIRHQRTVRKQTIDLPRARPTRAQRDHLDPARRNAYAQRTGSPAPDDAAPARRPVCAWRPRRDPTRARDRGPSHRSPHKPATCAHSGLNDPARRGRSSAIASLMRERSTRRRGFPCAGGQEKQPPAGGNGQATRRTLPRSPWRASLHPAQTVRTQP